MPFYNDISTRVADFSEFCFEHFDTLMTFRSDSSVNKRFLLFSRFSSCQTQEDVRFISVVLFSMNRGDEYFHLLGEMIPV